MAVKFIAVKGSGTIASSPFYIGLVQHERSVSKKEAYEIAAEQTGYKATAIKAVFMALAEYIRENQAKGNITYLDEVASIRNYVKGAFDTLTGPWAKGKNYLMIEAVEIDPFKSILSGVTPANNTEGANPKIDTVLDETTREYGEITGTDLFSIAGSDLGPDTTKDDEYVALVDADGVETKCSVTYSDLGNVKAQLTAALTAGEYTLKVYTRSGLGDEFGVKVATRKVTIK